VTGVGNHGHRGVQPVGDPGRLGSRIGKVGSLSPMMIVVEAETQMGV
jgi:hypothetical protein